MPIVPATRAMPSSEAASATGAKAAGALTGTPGSRRKRTLSTALRADHEGKKAHERLDGASRRKRASARERRMRSVEEDKPSSRAISRGEQPSSRRCSTSERSSGLSAASAASSWPWRSLASSASSGRSTCVCVTRWGSGVRARSRRRRCEAMARMPISQGMSGSLSSQLARFSIAATKVSCKRSSAAPRSGESRRASS